MSSMCLEPEKMCIVLVYSVQLHYITMCGAVNMKHIIPVGNQLDTQFLL
jgi:hypothetical protein